MKTITMSWVDDEPQTESTQRRTTRPSLPTHVPSNLRNSVTGRNVFVKPFGFTTDSSDRFNRAVSSLGRGRGRFFHCFAIDFL
ncbi:unnamed protein product [Ilex paraguariensis]|uniref:Uncharacterized protein n=2 Tax=Ilex paraguariensis TaxID=185542 RepID=A0ABC8RQA6_9AQUA